MNTSQNVLPNEIIVNCIRKNEYKELARFILLKELSIEQSTESYTHFVIKDSNNKEIIDIPELNCSVRELLKALVEVTDDYIYLLRDLTKTSKKEIPETKSRSKYMKLC